MCLYFCLLSWETEETQDTTEIKNAGESWETGKPIQSWETRPVICEWQLFKFLQWVPFSCCESLWLIRGKQLQVRGLRFPKRNQLHPVWFLDYHSPHIQHHYIYILGGNWLWWVSNFGQEWCTHIELVEKNKIFDGPSFVFLLSLSTQTDGQTWKY